MSSPLGSSPALPSGARRCGRAGRVGGEDAPGWAVRKSVISVSSIRLGVSESALKHID